MTQAFENLPEEKRARVINAGFSSFGKNGYAKTSMADVATAAGVSKASLFHYFGNKKQMYLYLYEFGTRLITGALGGGTLYTSSDMFDRLWATVPLKARILRQYPGTFDFYLNSFNDPAAQVDAEIASRYQAYLQQSTAKLLDGTDTTKLRSGVLPTDVMNLVTWVSEGYIRTAPPHYNMDDILGGATRYMNMIKTAVYKEEYL